MTTESAAIPANDEEWTKPNAELHCVSKRPIRLGPSRLAADNPAHRRIMSQRFGVVDILIASEAAEYRLPKQPDQRMATVLAAARVGEHLTGGLGWRSA